MPRVPPRARHPVAEPGQARPGPRDRSTAPVIADADPHASLAAAHRHRDGTGTCVLDRVRDRLGGDEVGRGADVVREVLRLQVQAHGERGVLAEVLQRRCQPVVEAAGAQSVRDLSQLDHGRAQLGHRAVEQVVDVDGAVTEVPLGQAQGHAQRHEALLGTVVQVELEATSLLVPGPHQPAPAGLDLPQRRAQLEPESTGLHQQRGLAGHLLEQPRTDAVAGHEHPDPVARQLDRCRAPVRVDPVSVAVDAVGVSGDGIADSQQRVTKRGAEHGFELLGHGRPRADLVLQCRHGRGRPRPVGVDPVPHRAHQPRAHRAEEHGDDGRDQHGHLGRGPGGDEARRRGDRGEDGQEHDPDEAVDGRGHDGPVHLVQVVADDGDRDGDRDDDVHRGEQDQQGDQSAGRSPRRRPRPASSAPGWAARAGWPAPASGSGGAGPVRPVGSAAPARPPRRPSARGTPAPSPSRRSTARSSAGARGPPTVAGRSSASVPCPARRARTPPRTPRGPPAIAPRVADRPGSRG